MTRHTSRITYRDQLLRNQATMNMYADLAGKPRVEIPGIPPAPKPRAPRAEPPAVPLERDIQKQIIDGLRMHPLIGMVERVNGGTAIEKNQDGSDRYIKFHHVYPVDGQFLRSVDIHCTLKPSGRRFVIEVKRPGWTKPMDERERNQAAYIQHVRKCGGFGMFATSWDQVSDKLRVLSALLVD